MEETLLDLDRKLEIIKMTFDIMYDIKKKRETELDIIIQGWKKVLATYSSVGNRR